MIFTPAFAQDSTSVEITDESIDDKVERYFSPVSNWIQSKVFYSISATEDTKVPLIVIWLAFGALVSTFYFKFINIRGFKIAIDIVRGKFTSNKEKGEISPFQALTTALSGTVGLGNIGGVAVAITAGGPGATFWMILAGLFGMSSKFVECTLGVKYRKIDVDGRVNGGPMYYLSQGFAERNMPGLGKFFAGFFAVMCIGGTLGGGNMYQVNQAYAQFVQATGGDSSFAAGHGWVFGLIIAILVGLVIIGGIRSIAWTTSKVVPFMCVIYVAASLVIILMNISEIPSCFKLIFQGAFSPEGVAGGAIGVFIQGLQRAAFSNEAGIGSASIAHSAVKTEHAASEGLVSLLEPFIDTVVVCTMTALVIILTSGATAEGLEGVALTSAAFESTISWFPSILTIAVILFAFSTMIAWSYYGQQAWRYLFGNKKSTDLAFKLIFCGFIVIGAPLELKSVIGFSDAMIFAMSVPNLIGLYLLMPVVKKELDKFMEYKNSK